VPASAVGAATAGHGIALEIRSDFCLMLNSQIKHVIKVNGEHVATLRSHTLVAHVKLAKFAHAFATVADLGAARR
jgi:hypothetical protein